MTGGQTLSCRRAAGVIPHAAATYHPLGARDSGVDDMAA